jgi:hypothetical protein
MLNLPPPPGFRGLNPDKPQGGPDNLLCGVPQTLLVFGFHTGRVSGTQLPRLMRYLSAF